MPTKIIYLHGMGGSPEDWRAVQTRQPGISLPIDASARSVEDCANKLAGEIERQAPGPFAICGYSMGGRLAILVARRLLQTNKRPEALILVSAGLGISSEEERAQRSALDEDWAKLAEENIEIFWEKWYQQEIFASFRSLPEASRSRWLDQRKSMDISTLSSHLRHLGPGKHDPLIPALKEVVSKGVRALYIAGELDKKYEELSHRVRELPGISVSNISGAGHILPLEAPEALAMRIAKFLK